MKIPPHGPPPRWEFHWYIQRDQVLPTPGPLSEPLDQPTRRTVVLWCRQHLRGPFRVPQRWHLDPILVEMQDPGDHMLVQLTWG
jgi:hypothetical protein